MVVVVDLVTVISIETEATGQPYQLKHRQPQQHLYVSMQHIRWHGLSLPIVAYMPTLSVSFII
jgi:hypothetical protein